MVSDVAEGPGMGAGILGGDGIRSFDGVGVQDTRQLVRVVGNSPVGKAVRVVIFRDSGTQTLMVTLGRREEAEGAVPASAETVPDEPVETQILGVTFSSLTDELREQLGLDADATGLVVTEVDEASEAFDKGLRAGDLVTEAGQQKVNAVEDIEDRIAEAREAGRRSLLLLVRRDGDPSFVALGLEE